MCGLWVCIFIEHKFKKVCEKLETGGKGHWSIIGNVVSSVEVGRSM